MTASHEVINIKTALAVGTGAVAAGVSSAPPKSFGNRLAEEGICSIQTVEGICSYSTAELMRMAACTWILILIVGALFKGGKSAYLFIKSFRSKKS